MDGKQTRPGNQSNLSSEKLLRLLEYLSTRNDPCRLGVMAADLQMNPSTTLRFLRVLQAQGYVVQEQDSGRYALTLKICTLADRIRSHNPMSPLSPPFLRRVSELFCESANLAVEDMQSVMYVDVANPPQRAMTHFKHIGSIAPLHCTGVGKLFLTQYGKRQLRQYIKTKGLTWFTENTITTEEHLMQELDSIRNLGHSYDDEECEIGVRCIAVPVHSKDGSIVAALSSTGPINRMTKDFIEARLDAMKEIAAEFSEVIV